MTPGFLQLRFELAQVAGVIHDAPGFIGNFELHPLGISSGTLGRPSSNRPNGFVGEPDHVSTEGCTRMRYPPRVSVQRAAPLTMM
jgi:hypothetical protein